MTRARHEHKKVRGDASAKRGQHPGHSSLAAQCVRIRRGRWTRLCSAPPAPGTAFALDWHIHLWNAVGIGRQRLPVALQSRRAALQLLRSAALSPGRAETAPSNCLSIVPAFTLRWDPPDNSCLFSLSLEASSW